MRIGLPVPVLVEVLLLVAVVLGSTWILNSYQFQINSEQTLMQCELYVVQRQTHLIYRV